MGNKHNFDINNPLNNIHFSLLKNMSPETKNIPTAKLPIPVTNPPGIMDEKTYQQYKLDSQKTLLRSAIITITASVAYAIIGGFPTDLIDPLFIAPILLIGGGFYIISKSKLHAKYKIPGVYHNNNLSFSKTTYSNYNCFSSDPFRDNNPTYPGTAAWHSRKMSD